MTGISDNFLSILATCYYFNFRPAAAFFFMSCSLRSAEVVEDEEDDDDDEEPLPELLEPLREDPEMSGFCTSVFVQWNSVFSRLELDEDLLPELDL